MTFMAGAMFYLQWVWRNFSETGCPFIEGYPIHCTIRYKRRQWVSRHPEHPGGAGPDIPPTLKCKSRYQGCEEEDGLNTRAEF